MDVVGRDGGASNRRSRPERTTPITTTSKIGQEKNPKQTSQQPPMHPEANPVQGMAQVAAEMWLATL